MVTVSHLGLDNLVFFFTNIGFMLWHTWKHICVCVFEFSSHDPGLVASKASSTAREFILISSLCSRVYHTVPGSSLYHWVAPPTGFHESNIDAAWIHHL